MFLELENINTKPPLFSHYTAETLWTNPHTAQKMLAYHLSDFDIASRNSAFIAESVKWIRSHFKLGEKHRVCDFGCGPGLYANALAKAGVGEIEGVDFSAHSIAYAQKIANSERLKNVQYHVQNYLEFSPNIAYDLVIMIMCDFCALSPKQRKSMLLKWHDKLAKDGCILIDLYSLRAFSKRAPQAVYEKNQLDGFWSVEEYYGFVNTFVYEKEKVVLDKYTIITSHETKEVFNWLQYFDLESISAEFAACGFVIEEVYDDVAGTPYTGEHTEFAVVARKVTA